jgi:hypothetical protein
VYRLTVEADHYVQATFVELADNVRQLDKATAAALVEMAPDESRLVFASSTPLLDGLVEGDILANSLDDGLAEPVMVRIHAIDRDGERVVLATEPAPLTDLLKNASVAVVLPMRFSSPEGATASLRGPPPIRARPFGVGANGTTSLHAAIGVDLDEWPCDGLTCKVRAEGELDVSFDVVTDIDISLLRRRIEVYVVGDEEATLRLLANAGLSGQGRKLVLSADVLQIVLAFGPLPVWITPGLDIWVGGSWELTADVRAEGTLRAHQKVGARLDGRRFSRIGEHSEDVSGSAEWVGGTAKLSAYLSPEPRVSVYHFCDVSANVQAPYAELEADLRETPWWTLYGGARLVWIGAKCTFTDPYKFDFEVGVRTILAQADGPFEVTPAPALCSASDLSPQSEPQPGLPEEVARMRESIVAAAVACDYDRLEELALAGEFFYYEGLNDYPDSPASFWQEREESGHDPLWTLAQALTEPYGSYYDVSICGEPFGPVEPSPWPPDYCVSYSWDRSVEIQGDGDWSYFRPIVRMAAGSCGFLEERYCDAGVPLTRPLIDVGVLGFNLPPGTPVVAPEAGWVCGDCPGSDSIDLMVYCPTSGVDEIKYAFKFAGAPPYNGQYQAGEVLGTLTDELIGPPWVEPSDGEFNLVVALVGTWCQPAG